MQSNWDKKYYLFQKLNQENTSDELKSIEANTQVKKAGSQGVTITWPFSYNGCKSTYLRFNEVHHATSFLEIFENLKKQNKGLEKYNGGVYFIN